MGKSKTKAVRKRTLRERLLHACAAPTGVHSILDVLVLADVVHTIKAGALSVAFLAGGWYGLRTLIAFVATYIEELEA